MKAMLTALSLAVIVTLFTLPGRSFAQTSDTVWVTPSMGGGSLSDYIGGDTLTGGVRANPKAIYALYQDSLYFFTGTINQNGNLTIVGQSGPGRPPVIAPAVNSDGSSPAQFLKTYKGSLTLRNLYLLGITPKNQWLGWGIATEIVGDSLDVTIDSCVFDGWSAEAIGQSGSWDNIYVTNCMFMNLINSGAWFYGEAFRGESGTPIDTIMMVNNTFFNLNGYAFCPTGYCTLERFVHNTVVLNMVNPMNDFVASNQEIKDNIYYSTLMEGQTPVEFYGGWFDDPPYGSSTISLDTLFGLENQYPVTEATRKVIVVNNSYFWPDSIKGFWNAWNDTVSTIDSVSYDSIATNGGKLDTILVKAAVRNTLLPPVWMNGRTQNMFSNKTTFPGFASWGNTEADPGFGSFVDNQLDSAIKFVLYTRTGQLGSYVWNYHPDGPLFSWTWPLPNLAYSNTALKSGASDGFAVGDLNWFPTQKAAWLAAGGLATGVKPVPATVATKFDLSNNYPNPFNPSTDIKVSLKQAGVMSLTVYNVLGQVVQVVDQGYKPAGQYLYNVNMDRFASGVYFYSLRQGTNVITKKMLLLK